MPLEGRILLMVMENNPLFAYLEVFDSDLAEGVEISDRYLNAKIGDVEIKLRLAE